MLKYIWQEYCESFYSWEKIITDPNLKRDAEHLVLTWVNQGPTTVVVCLSVANP